MTDTRTTVTAHTTHHHTSAEVAEDIRDIVEGHEPRDISDNSALAIASWWQGPDPQGRVFAQLASTGTADADDLLESIADARRIAGDDTKSLTELDHLEAWVYGRAAL